MSRLSSMPNQPRTPHTTLRIPVELKQAVQEIAAEQGETLTDVVLRALRGYVASHGRDVPSPSPRSSSSP